jgi:hypothetical protein
MTQSFSVGLEWSARHAICESVHTVSTVHAKSRGKIAWTPCRPPDEASQRRHSSPARTEQNPLSEAYLEIGAG